MFDSSSVKVGILVLIGFLGFIFSISAGILGTDYLENQKLEKCIAADRIWFDNSCVRNINDLRFVDKD